MKPVIHIADEETRIPFDNAQHRAILFRRSNWTSFEGLKAGLLAQLEAIEEEGFKVSNPITHARGRIEVAKSGDDRDQLISDLMARMDQMEQATRGVRNLDRLYWRRNGSGYEGEVNRPKKVVERISEFAMDEPGIAQLGAFIRDDYSEYIRDLDVNQRADFVIYLQELLPKSYAVVARSVIRDIAGA